MLVLDTDHFSELERGSDPGHRLAQKLQSSPHDSALTIITVEEQIRGWLAEIHRRRDTIDQVSPYSKLQHQVEIYADWIILPWDAEASELFVNFRRAGVHIGSMDLKIACIAVAHDSTLLTRNIVDFSEVPGLRTENWLA